jgi:hypothetical protein
MDCRCGNPRPSDVAVGQPAPASARVVVTVVYHCLKAIACPYEISRLHESARAFFKGLGITLAPERELEKGVDLLYVACEEGCSPGNFFEWVTSWSPHVSDKVNVYLHDSGPDTAVSLQGSPTRTELALVGLKSIESELLVHHLGHCFGLVHHASSENFMHPSCPPGGGWDPPQAERARSFLEASFFAESSYARCEPPPAARWYTVELACIFLVLVVLLCC